MEIQGTMVKILPVEEITFSDGAKNNKGGFVIKRLDYPKMVFFEVFGKERIALLESIQVGASVNVSFYAESHESKNGYYITSLRCINIVNLSATPTAAGAPSATAQPAEAGQADSKSDPDFMNEDIDDLLF